MGIYEIIATATALSGNLLVNKRNRFGFILWVIANIMWVVWGVCMGEFGQIPMYAVYTVLAVHGFRSWAKEAKSNEEAKEN